MSVEIKWKDSDPESGERRFLRVGVLGAGDDRVGVGDPAPLQVVQVEGVDLVAVVPGVAAAGPDVEPVALRVDRERESGGVPLLLQLLFPARWH